MDEYYIQLKLTLDEVRLLEWLSRLNDVVINPEEKAVQSEEMKKFREKVRISIYKSIGDLNEKDNSN